VASVGHDRRQRRALPPVARRLLCVPLSFTLSLSPSGTDDGLPAVFVHGDVGSFKLIQTSCTDPSATELLTTASIALLCFSVVIFAVCALKCVDVPVLPASSTADKPADLLPRPAASTRTSCTSSESRLPHFPFGMCSSSARQELTKSVQRPPRPRLLARAGLLVAARRARRLLEHRLLALVRLPFPSLFHLVEGPR